MAQQQMAHAIQTTNLADILERVLDKGIIIAGDIQIKIADIDLLTIKIRLLIASVEKALEMGINWWQYDSYLSGNQKRTIAEKENAALKKKTNTLKNAYTTKPSLRGIQSQSDPFKDEKDFNTIKK
jgi:hypothetical protein